MDAIFSAVSGVWGRVFSFFGACWLGFAVGVATASLEWREDMGAEIADATEHWYFVPIAWMFGSIACCFRWWGIPHLLALIIAAYQLVYLEASVCQTVCLLFLMESWFWWSVGSFAEEQYSWVDWHPLLPVLVLLSLGAAWMWWRSWKNNHPANDEAVVVVREAPKAKLAVKGGPEVEDGGVEGS